MESLDRPNVLPIYDPKLKLVCIPRLEAWESPTSWLTRAALSQFTLLTELITYLGLQTRGDLDMDLAIGGLSEVGEVCGVTSVDFDFKRMMFSRLKRIDDTVAQLLLAHHGFPLYLHDPICLKE